MFFLMLLHPLLPMMHEDCVNCRRFLRECEGGGNYIIDPCEVKSFPDGYMCISDYCGGCNVNCVVDPGSKKHHAPRRTGTLDQEQCRERVAEWEQGVNTTMPKVAVASSEEAKVRQERVVN
ncbi:hypothetical protein ACHAWF_013612 [Thalassiosira exigua]